MSAQAVKQIIGKAVIDPTFRESLLRTPDSAVAGFDLTMEERASLKGLTEEQFNTLAGEFDERISRAATILFGKH